jgi:hypothetical protein
MEKTLFSNKFVSLKFVKNTILFGISYDRPQLFIVVLCFIVEFNFAKAKKRPQNYI